MFISILKADIFQVLALLSFGGVMLGLYVWRDAPPPDVGRLSRSMVMSTLILLGVIAGLNVLVDPYGSTGTGLVVDNALGERDKKPALLLELPQPPDVLMLGSSRMMLLDPAQIEQTCGLSAFNGGVFGADTEDELAMYTFVREELRPPKFVIIALDLETLDGESGFGERLVFTPLFAYSPASTSQKIHSWFGGITTFLYSKTTSESIRLLDLTLHDAIPPARYGLDENGKLLYLTQQEVRPALAAALDERTLIPYWQGYTELNPARVDALEKLVAQAVEDGAEVYLFINPEQPDYLARVVQEPNFEARLMDEIALLERLEREYGATWYNFLAVQSFGGDPDNFIDATHYHDENAQKLLSLILEDMCDAL